jgi:hypothetical protein
MGDDAEIRTGVQRGCRGDCMVALNTSAFLGRRSTSMILRYKAEWSAKVASVAFFTFTLG